MKRAGSLIRLGVLTLISAMMAAFSGVPAGTGVVHAQADSDDADWARALSDGTLDSIDAYLARHPLGRHASEAFALSTRLSRQGVRSIGEIEPQAGPGNTVGGASLSGLY